MGIRKQEFYEGAALHVLVRGGQIFRLQYEAPFFLLNERLSVLLKYSTKTRSPWGFSFTPDEQKILQQQASRLPTAVGLICGADGIAAVSYEALITIGAPRTGAIHIACYRNHGELYEVNGPDGTLDRKVSPSNWQRILDC